MASNDGLHDPHTDLKKRAAEAALDLVKSGMVLGLGTGRTAVWVVRGLSERLGDGRLKDVRGIPTSTATESEARRLAIPLTSLEADPVIDMTIDGADEVDPRLNLIKGGGGALLREKIVAWCSIQYVIVVDESKYDTCIGTHWAVPVEVIEFGWRNQQRFLESLGAEVRLRLSAKGEPFRTDSENIILDCRFGPITDPVELANNIKQRTGVVEHGLFIGLVDQLVIAGDTGIRFLTPE